MSDAIAVFVFRRDLRINDNIAFIQAAKSGAKILPVFIFNPQQIDRVSNPYFSSNCVQFMIECLESLSDQLVRKGYDRLHLLYGNDADVLGAVYKKHQFSSLYTNADYTPFARNRDQALGDWCTTKGIAFHSCQDYTLHGINDIKTGTGKPYAVFTPFYKACVARDVFVPQKAPKAVVEFECKKLPTEISWKKAHAFYDTNDRVALHGGRKNGLAILKRIANGEFNKYDKDRDDVAAAKTTMASAYLKFGCISVREMYHAVGNKHHGLVRELYWREFYANVAYHFDHVLRGQLAQADGNQPMKPQYARVAWTQRDEWFDAWTTGTTGFPIVDAGMRQMLATGFMHNRLRMIVSSFLIKDMHIDWRDGERFFASQLIDYDPASNSGGWQWSASTGADSQPYFRIFNPWSQHERFDRDAVYIKRWVPELAAVSPKDLLKWYDPKVRAKYQGLQYPAPVLNHDKERQVALHMYKQ
jgi:deoxyribodipyrimidine photo-lyase